MLLSGGLLAKAYLQAVFLWILNSRAIALSDSPLSLASCTFSHRVLWRAVGILCCCALDLRGLKSRQKAEFVTPSDRPCRRLSSSQRWIKVMLKAGIE